MPKQPGSTKRLMQGMIAFILLASALYALLSMGLFRTQAAKSQSLTPGPGDWTTFQGDLGRSGYNAAETTITPANVAQLKVLWSRQEGTSISSQPVVVGGRIFWSSWDGLEHATDLNGNDVWTTNIGTTTPPAQNHCSPVTAGPAGTATVTITTINGTPTPVVYVNGGDSKIYALNADTGSVIWSTKLGSVNGDMLWAGPAVYNGQVYIGVSSYGDCPLISGEFFQLDATTGVIVHSFMVVQSFCKGGGVWDNPTIDTVNGLVYFSTGTIADCQRSPETMAVGLVALHLADFSLQGTWQVPLSEQVGDGDFGSTPTLFQATIGGVVHQMVGLINKNGIYYAFDRMNITAGPLWETPIAVSGHDIGASAWDGTRLYVGGMQGTVNGNTCIGVVRALDPATGAVDWSYCAPSRVLASIMEVPGLIVTGSAANIVALDANTGNQLFLFHDPKPGAAFEGTPVIVHGVLYAGNMGGNFYAFSLPGGPPTPTPTPPPTPSPTPPPATLFQDNFDGYAPGPLPTGTGTNQWTLTHATGTGFGVAVSNTHASSAPNALQIALGSGPKGLAWARKDYSVGQSSHALRFSLFLDPNLSSTQSLPIFTTENRTSTLNGSITVWLAVNHTLQIVWYDSQGVKHHLSTPVANKLNSGQWYTIEMDQVNDATNGSWTLWLNGTQLLSQSTIDMGSLPVNTIIAGDTMTSSTVMAGAYYIDDVITSTRHLG